MENKIPQEQVLIYKSKPYLNKDSLLALCFSYIHFYFNIRFYIHFYFMLI